MSTNTKAVEALEVAAVDFMAEALASKPAGHQEDTQELSLLSIAISLKRIADALAIQTIGKVSGTVNLSVGRSTRPPHGR